MYFFSSIIYVKLGINDWYDVVSFYSITVLENSFVIFAACCLGTRPVFCLMLPLPGECTGEMRC